MSSISHIIIPIFLLLLILSASIFTPYHLGKLLGIKRIKVWRSVLVTIIISSFFGMVGIARVNNPVLIVLVQFSAIWIGLFLYIFDYMIVVEIVRWIKPFSKKVSGITIITLASLTTIYGYINALSYDIEEIEISLKGVKEEVKIYHLPDIHLGVFRGEEILQSLKRDIEKLDPDVILLNGDLVDSQEDRALKALDELEGIDKTIYFTSGNHDLYVDYKRLVDKLNEVGVRVVNNEVIDTLGVQIVGMKYMNVDDETYDPHASPDAMTIKSFTEDLKIDRSKPSIFVHHSPVGVEYINSIGGDLYLSGHTHAGQLFPATFFAKLRFPFLEGLDNYKDTKVYVSRGVGTFGPPLRVGTRGEATLIKIVGEE